MAEVARIATELMPYMASQRQCASDNPVHEKWFLCTEPYLRPRAR